MTAAAFGTRDNPSRWARRLPEAALATLGVIVAGYLASYQLGIVHAVWDPLFGSASSASVVESPLSRSLPVPDAALGTLAYLVEAALALTGRADRWISQSWLVVVFGLVVAGLGVTAIGLVLIQAFVVHAWCSLCLTSAVISLVMSASAFPEVRAAVGVLAARRARSFGPLRSWCRGAPTPRWRRRRRRRRLRRRRRRSRDPRWTRSRTDAATETDAGTKRMRATTRGRAPRAAVERRQRANRARDTT